MLWQTLLGQGTTKSAGSRTQFLISLRKGRAEEVHGKNLLSSQCLTSVQGSLFDFFCLGGGFFGGSHVEELGVWWEGPGRAGESTQGSSGKAGIPAHNVFRQPTRSTSPTMCMSNIHHTPTAQGGTVQPQVKSRNSTARPASCHPWPEGLGRTIKGENGHLAPWISAERDLRASSASLPRLPASQLRGLRETVRRCENEAEKRIPP